MTHPNEYCVAVWVKQNGHHARVFDTSFAYRTVFMDAPALAAVAALTESLHRGLVVPGNSFDIDVSEDSSDEWTTVLRGSL